MHGAPSEGEMGGVMDDRESRLLQTLANTARHEGINRGGARFGVALVEHEAIVVGIGSCR